MLLMKAPTVHHSPGIYIFCVITTKRIGGEVDGIFGCYGFIMEYKHESGDEEKWPEFEENGFEVNSFHCIF